MLRFQFFPNWAIDSIQSQPKFQQAFVEIDELILNFMWKYKEYK
jgi:hypothetical protein